MRTWVGLMYLINQFTTHPAQGKCLSTGNFFFSIFSTWRCTMRLYCTNKIQIGSYQGRTLLWILVESLAVDDVPVLPAVGPGGEPGAGHNISHHRGSRLRLCAVCKTRGIKKRSRYWCPGFNCGIHRECFSALEHFWRPLKLGRKRKASDAERDSD